MLDKCFSFLTIGISKKLTVGTKALRQCSISHLGKLKMKSFAVKSAFQDQNCLLSSVKPTSLFSKHLLKGLQLNICQQAGTGTFTI